VRVINSFQRHQVQPENVAISAALTLEVDSSASRFRLQ